MHGFFSKDLVDIKYDLENERVKSKILQPYFARYDKYQNRDWKVGCCYKSILDPFFFLSLEKRNRYLILLVAMIGAIVLTMHRTTKVKRQDVFRRKDLIEF